MITIVEKIEESAHHFLHGMKAEYTETRESAVIVRKYMTEGTITTEEEQVLKTELVDSLKMAGVMIPFVLVPGASILMPILIKVADKHNIELMPSGFNDKPQPRPNESSGQA
jgi:hypothetical protein